MASWEVDSVSAVNSGDMGAAQGDVPSTDQRMKRSYAIYTDQHGRVWGANIENKTGDPCGNLEPQFAAPVRPMDKYITVNSRRRQVVIRYAEIIQDIVEAEQEWDSALRDHARKAYGMKAHEAIQNPPPDLLDIVGPRPKERREPWEAAMQGNKWVLGLSPNKPDWATEFFPDAPKVRETFQIETNNKYPDAEDQAPKSTEITWAGPQHGWKLPDGTYVKREDGESGEEHKARATALAAS